MLFSDSVGLSRPRGEWFDPILETDTELFVDPFLLESSGVAEFADARREVVRFFELAYELVARSTGPHDQRHGVVDRMLRFPEPHEFRIGYSGPMNPGRGPGKVAGAALKRSIEESLNRALISPERFEEVALFQERVGPDSVSDICLNVLKHRFIAFTARVARDWGFPMTEAIVPNARFDFGDARWVSQRVEVPATSTGAMILLLPKAVLAASPAISKEQFQGYLWATARAQIAAEFGYALVSDLNARRLVEIARTSRALVDAFRQFAVEHAAPYPIDRDPTDRYKPYVEARAHALVNRLAHPQVQGCRELPGFATFLIDDFRNQIEDRRHSYQLWEQGKPRNERAARLAFWGRAEVLCQDAGVSGGMEVDHGAGPADVTIEVVPCRAVIELKLMSNPRYWHGLDIQLPAYVRAAGRESSGHFVGIALKDAHANGDKWSTLRSRARAAATRTRLALDAAAVDGRIRPAASSL